MYIAVCTVMCMFIWDSSGTLSVEMCFIGDYAFERVNIVSAD